MNNKKPTYHAKHKRFRQEKSIEICALIKLAKQTSYVEELERYLEEIKELVLQMV